MSQEAYRDLAFNNMEKLKQEEVDRETASKNSLGAQSIWSDRLAKATAGTYGELLHQIANDTFPELVIANLHELLE